MFAGLLLFLAACVPVIISSRKELEQIQKSSLASNS